MLDSIKSRKFIRLFFKLALAITLLIVTLLAFIPFSFDGVSHECQIEKSMVFKAHSNLKTFKEGLDIYYDRFGEYPVVLTELVAGQVFMKIPVDPWGQPYLYSRSKSGYVIKTLGADQIEGGDGINTDIDGNENPKVIIEQIKRPACGN